MNIPRIRSTTLIVQVLWLLAGCCTTEQTFHFQWTGITLTHLDNRGASAVESTSDSISARAYGIRMKIADQMQMAARFTPLPTAHATSCAEIFTFVNQDTLRALRIHAIASDSGSAPLEVTDLFRVMAVGPGPVPQRLEKFLTIPELVRRMNENTGEHLLCIDVIRSGSLDRSNGTRFTVTMELSGGRTIVDTTGTITLL